MTLPLFKRDLSVVCLGSGSKGNATWVGDRSAGVLIDCGLSTKQIVARLDSVGMADAPIDAVLVTHEHSDHVGSARVLCARLKKRAGKSIPFYMTSGTYAGTHSNCRPDAVEEIEAGSMFRVRHLDVHSFSVPHDTRDPVAFRVGVDGLWAGVVSDLGKPTGLVERMLATLSIAVLEFNHDVDMLKDGSYPWHLKQRILSTHGHLSNDAAAEMLGRALQTNSPLKHLVLAHLSEENNRPRIAWDRCRAELTKVDALERVKVEVARQAEALAPITVSAAA